MQFVSHGLMMSPNDVYSSGLASGDDDTGYSLITVAAHLGNPTQHTVIYRIWSLNERTLIKSPYYTYYMALSFVRLSC